MGLNYKEIEVIIDRDDDDKCALVFPEINNTRINLADSRVDDIEKLFNNLFSWIIDNSMLIKLFTRDETKDLYNEVTLEMIDQLNAEIKQSENDFYAIIEIMRDNPGE